MLEQKKTRQWTPSWWWIGWAAILLLWYVVAFVNQRSTTPAVPLAYSTFVAQVRAGNVTRVEIMGEQITGQFAKPYRATSTGQAASQSYTAFTTTYPQVMGDQTLLPLLDHHHIQIDVLSTQNWLTALLGLVPWIVLAALMVWSVRRMSQAGLSATNFGRATPARYTSEAPKITFNDVAGAEEAKAELQEEVDFLRRPEKYHAIGARIPKGILLVGPPGTGKTLLARAVAGEANVPYFSLSASEFVEMFVGVGASRVRDLFKQAKQAAPAIVFIDELDAVGRRRGAGIGTVNDEREQTLNQLLGELDGFDPRDNIIVLAATNRPDVLDPALLRPGRFDRQVTIPLPDRHGRLGILLIHVKKLRLAPGVDLEKLAGLTIGMNGADLENLANEAALGAVRHNRDAVAMEDFEEALDRVRLGAATAQAADPEDLRVVAYHEAGHTVAAWLTPGADPVAKVTIVAHGMALGMTEQLPAQERKNMSASYLRARLIVMLAGRSSEELAFGEATTGAEEDLVGATKLARQMVTTWGMGSIGLLSSQSREEQPFLGYELATNHDYSEATAARIDTDVNRILEEAHSEARRLLAAARPQLDQLAQALLKDETVTADGLTRILGASQTLSTTSHA